MNEYPSEVTLYDDGVYRWRYDMDMWHNRYLLRLVLKVIALVLGVPLLFLLAMALVQTAPLLRENRPWEDLLFFMRDDMIPIAVVGGLLVGCLLLALTIYAICALVMGGSCRLRFEMDDTAVTLVRNPGTTDAINALGTVAVIAGMAAGKPGEALRAGGTLAAASSTGASRFDSTRRVKLFPDSDVIDLREWFGMNQIFVSPGDYAFVRDYILARVPEKTRDRSRL